eukprot:3935952-Rhodomonas_salina.1
MQPFVFAGDIALWSTTACTNKRLWDGDDTETATLQRTCSTVLDVMKITSKEHNEFQLQHIVPDGMAVTRRPTTIAMTQEVLRYGMVTLPPVIVQSVYMHNPATATRDAVWYAVNPDYEMLHCLLRYCSALEGLVNCCQTNQETGVPICPPHAATSIAFNDSFTLNLGTSNTFDVGKFCNENVHYNLYVEDMEAFDDLNVI